MNVFFATESGLALRIRRTWSSKNRRRGTGSRLVTAALLCSMAAITLPSSGVAQTRERADSDDGRGRSEKAGSDRDRAAAYIEGVGLRIRAAVEKGELTAEEGRAKIEAVRREIGEIMRKNRVWSAAMATDPDEWSAELKAAILELKPESTIEEVAEGIRKRQQYARDKRGIDLGELEVIGREIRAAIANGELTAEQGRARYEAARRALGEKSEGGEKSDEHLRDFQRGVLARAMAIAPEEWNDELKVAIQRAGWDLEKFTEGVRQRQAGARESTDLLQLANPNTAVEDNSWGQVKKEAGESEK